MRGAWLLAAWVCGSAAVAEPQAAPPPSPPVSSTPSPGHAGRQTVVVLRISGGLDCGDAVGSLRSAARAASEHSAAWLVIDIRDAAAFRTDVVRDMARVLGEMDTKSAVVLVSADDKSPRVSAAGVTLGLCADALYVSEKATVEAAPTDDKRELLVRAPKWSTVEADLRELTRAGLASRGKDEAWGAGWSAALVAPTARWALSPGSCVPAREGVEPIASPTAAADPVGTPHGIRVPASRLIGCGLAIPADGPDAALRHLRGEHATQKVAATIETLGDASTLASSAAAELEALAAALDARETQLDELPEPGDPAFSDQSRRRTATRVLEELSRIADRVSQLDQTLQRTPEIMRTPAPGRVVAGTKPSSHAARWRSLVQQRKDRLAKLEREARSHAGGP